MVGTHVDLELIDQSGCVESLALDIVADEQADLERGFLGAGTPLARAIIGRRAGDSVAYRLGDVVQVRILRIAPAVRAPSADVQARRAATLREAVARSEMTNDMIFALAAGSKWGDYDPSKIAAPPKAQAAHEEDDPEGATDK